MVDLKRFKPKLVTTVPPETSEFLSYFKGHTTITTISQASKTDGRQTVVSYNSTNPDTYTYVGSSNKNGHDVYFTVNETSDSGRKAHDIESIRAVFADDDKPRSSPRTDWKLQPSIVVVTSTHTDEKTSEDGFAEQVYKYKYHYYWLTSTTNVDEWERVMEGIVKWYDTDPAVKDLARLLRLPGYANCKYGARSDCKMQSDNGTVYEWDTILEHFPPVTKQERKETNPVKSGEDFNSFAKEAMFLSGKNISDPLNSLIAHWAYHYSADKIRIKVDQLMDQIPSEIRNDQGDRYYKAYVQVDKWITSAKNKVTGTRAAESIKEINNMEVIARPLEASGLVDFTPIQQDCVAPCIFEAASEMGRFLANGTEPSLISAQAIVCATLGKNVKIHEMGEDTTTFCSSGIIIAMETGTRKTQIYKHLSKPLTDYETRLQKDWEDKKMIIEASASMYKEKEKHLETEMKKLAKTDASRGEEEALIMKMADVKGRLSDLQIARPTLTIKDVTEEEVISKMYENQGALAVVSDDSRNIIKNILGRYGDNTAEGWIIDGMGGTDIKYNRAKNGGTEFTVNDPCLNLYLMVQPDMAIKFKDHEVYKQSGLAARVPVYFYPIDPLEMLKKSDRTRRLDATKMAGYYSALNELCVRRTDRPMIVELSEQAEARFNVFNNKFLKLLQTEWKGEYNKTNKIITQAVVMATVTAAMDDPSFRVKLQTDPAQNIRYTLGAKHANMGCMYIEAIYSGMVRSTDSLDDLGTADVAMRFIHSLVKAHEKGKITEGFLNSSHLQNSFKMINKDNRHSIVEMLLDNGWLIATKSESFQALNNGFPGGKASPGDIIYHLNAKEVDRQLRMKQKQDQAEAEAKITT